ncbi:MAG: hypothetical protein ACLTW7_15990, partial [Enterococcus sp.]|uniref:hypothetical protein n=1 Tax=Enterococcus sp. TaxID=35783 RepID=UPI003994259F
YRERKIAELDQLLLAVKEQQEQLKAQLAHLDQQQQLLLDEVDQFPSDTDFQSAKKELDDTAVQLKESKWLLQQAYLQLNELTHELQQIQFIFEKELSDYYGDKTYDGLGQAIQAIVDYEDTLEDLKSNHTQIINDQTRFSERENYRAALQEEQEGFFLDQGEITRTLSKTEQLLKENRSQQALEDLEKLSRELDHLKEEEREITEKEKI